MSFSMQIMAREIATAISLCAQVVDASSKIPILKCTRISVADGMVSFMATNTQQTLTTRAACDGEGTICIDTQALAAKIATLKADAPVDFAGDGKTVTIKQRRARWIAPLMFDDFPMQLAAPLDAEPIQIGIGYMRAIEEAWGIIDAGHPVVPITGLRLQDNRVIATDGKSCRVIQVHVNMPKPIIVPIKLASKLRDMFPNGGVMRCNDLAMSMDSDNLSIKSQLVEGRDGYPDVAKIMAGFADKLAAKVTVNRDGLLAAMKRAGAIRQSGEKNLSFLNMQLRFRDGEIEVFARNMDGEEGLDAVECGGDLHECDIGFSGNQLLKEIGSMDAETIEISYGDARTPIVIRAGESLRFIQTRDFR